MSVNGVLVVPPSATTRAFELTVDEDSCRDDVEISDVVAAAKQWKKNGSRFKVTVIDTEMVFEAPPEHVAALAVRLAQRFARDEMNVGVSESELARAVAAYVPPARVKVSKGDVLELQIDDSCRAFAYVFRTHSTFAWCGVLYDHPRGDVRFEHVAALVMQETGVLASDGWRPIGRAAHDLDLDALPYRCGKDAESLPRFSVADVARAVCGHMYWNMMGGFPSRKVSKVTPERAVLATDERWDEFCMLEYRNQYAEAYRLRFTDHGWEAYQAAQAKKARPDALGHC